MSAPRISADFDSPRVELSPEALERRLELLDSDVEPGQDSKRSAYNAPSSRDPSEGMSTGPRREANPERPYHDISDGETPSSEVKKPFVKKWTPAEDVKRELPKKRYDYGNIPYEKIFPKDEDIAKGNYKLTPQNNALTKEASEARKPKVDSGDEDKSRNPRRSANKIEPQKVKEYKGSDYEPKLHKYDTAYTYDRGDSPYALNYLNSKGFSHAIPEPGHEPVSDGPRAAQPRTAQSDITAPGETTSPSRRPRRRSVGGGCCCSKSAVEVDDQRPQVKHQSPGGKVHTPVVNPGIHPGTVETEPIYISTLRYTFKNTPLVRPHGQFPDFNLTSPSTKPHNGTIDVATPSAELRTQKPHLQTRAQTPPPRVKYRNTCCTCCSHSDVDTIDSPRRSPPARIQYRTPTPEVDLNLNKPEVKVHPPEKVHVQGKVDPPEKIHIQGKVDPPEKIQIQSKVGTPKIINIQGKVDPPAEKIHVQSKVDPPEKIHVQSRVDTPEKIHIQSPRVIFPKANFNNPRYNFKSPNPTLKAKGLKGPTISRPSLRLAQPRTNYRLNTPPKLNFRRPRLSPIKPIRVNLPSLRRSKQNEAEAKKVKPNTETDRPKNPKVTLNTPKARIRGPEVRKPAVDVRRPVGPSVKVNGKKPTPVKIKDPRPVEATVEGPELDYRNPYHLSTEIPTPPSSRIHSPEPHLPRPDIPPSKPIHAEIRTPELSLPRAEIHGGTTKPTIKPIEPKISEHSLPRAELKGDIAAPKISVKTKKPGIHPVTINEPDFSFEGPDIHTSDPEFHRQDPPHANANTKAPRDANFQLDAPRIRNPNVATYNPKSMIKPTFADLHINAPRSEVTESPPRIRTPDFEPHIPDRDQDATVRPGKIRIPEPKAEIKVPEFREPPEMRFDVTPPPKPTAHLPKFKAEVEKPSVSLPPAAPPTHYPHTEDLERPRPERNTISLPRLPQPPRASVKFDSDPPQKQTAHPPRNPSPPEQVPPLPRSSPQRPPQQGPPQQRPPPDQNTPWTEPIKWRLRRNTDTKAVSLFNTRFSSEM